MFLVSQILVNFEISSSLKLCTNLEMRGFSPSYQILLSLFDILNTFYDNIWVNIKAKMCQMV